MLTNLIGGTISKTDMKGTNVFFFSNNAFIGINHKSCFSSMVI